ncbi:MAG: 3-phosphoshikimate 1-carboxyvinyltransferase [Candidatus Symbiodolus clandestinus]
MSLTLAPRHQVAGVVTVPGSKSLANRALLLAALAHGTSEIRNLPLSDDVSYLLRALRTLGVTYYQNKAQKHCQIVGCGGQFPATGSGKALFLGNAGTALRPLTAILSLDNRHTTAVNWVITGEPRMQARPIAPLVEALQQGGAVIKYCATLGYPPLQLQGGFRGGRIRITGRQSSQFLSALLMVAPLAEQQTVIEVDGPLISQPYVAMTLQMMRHFGVKVDDQEQRWFAIPGRQHYRACSNLAIEGDAATASYFLAAAAIQKGTIRINGIGQESQQGEKEFAAILQRMGAQIRWGNNYLECQGNRLVGIEVDMGNQPDSAMTLAIVALFAQGATTIRNIYHWRFKESDRLTAMVTGLTQVGAKVEMGVDFIHIQPPIKFKPALINTYQDHRLVMCFSLVTLAGVPVTLSDPNCVSKSFPHYFSEFERVTTPS